MRATQICCDAVPPDLKRVADMINQGAGTRVPGAEQRKRNASRHNAGDKYARLMPDTIGLRTTAATTSSPTCSPSRG